MKENYIYQILKQFFVNSYPPEIEEKVQKWIINDKWTTEKNKAMSAIWDEVEIAPNDNTYKALDRVKNRIKQIEHSKKHFRIRRVLLGSAAVIIPILLILGSYIYLNQDVQMIEVVTASNQQKQCTLADGTTIVLNSCTKITYPSKFNDTTRVVTLEGEAYFKVTKNKARPFVVKSQGQEIKVLGTSFNVRNRPNEDLAETTLISGAVSLCFNNDSVPVRLNPNEQITYSKSNQSIRKDTVVAHEYIAWTTEKMTFDNDRFTDVISYLEDKYQLQIICPEEIADTLYLTLVVRNETKEEIFKEIARISHLQYSIHNDTVYFDFPENTDCQTLQHSL